MTDITDIKPFDVCGPLPQGVTVLEASAGTGKTFTIAALAARYVAEGTPLEQLLLVTFTRMATGELRERVRERLVSAEQALDRALAGDPPTDEVNALLAQGPSTEVEQRRERLARALADFDAATIATTHGFCQEVLGGLGVAGDVDPDAVFVEDVERSARGRRRRPLRAPLARQRHPAVRPRAGDADRPGRGRTTPPCASSPSTRRRAPSRRCAAGSRSPPRRARRPQAPDGGHDLRRPPHPARRDAQGPGRRSRGRAPARALPRRARRRVPGHRPGPVGHHAPRVRRGRRRRSSSSATPSRRSTPSAAPTSTPTSRRRGRPTRRRRSTSTGAATRASSTPTTRCSRGAKLGHEGIVYRKVRAADANQTPRLSRAPVDAPLRIRVVAPRRAVDHAHTRRPRAATPPPASTSPTTSRPTSRALLSSERRDRDPRPGRHHPAPRADPPRPRRRPRPHPPQRRAHPRRPRRGRHPRRHQRRGQRLRHRAGARLAAPARGDRTALVARARRLRRAHPVPGLERPSGSRPPTTTTARSSTGACTSGRASCASRAWPR